MQRFLVLSTIFILLSGFIAPSTNSTPKWLIQVNDSLWASKFEVSVADYNEFLVAMGTEAATHLPDSSSWMKLGSWMDPLKDTYFNHPAFHNYPIVGITYESATAYCAWLTEEYRKISPELPITFRLPSEAEWMEAGYAGDSTYLIPMTGKEKNRLRRDGSVKPRDLPERFNLCYPDPLCLEYKGENEFEIEKGCPGYRLDGYTFTAPVNTFPASRLGAYHLGGNAAEMVQEKGISKGGSWYDYPYALRLEKQGTYEGPDARVGFRVFAELGEG